MMESRKKNSASAYLLFFVLILTVAAAAVLLLPVYRDYQKKKAEEEKLREELADRTETSAALNSEVAGLRNDPEEIEKVAREKFELVRDGETVMRYDSPKKNK